MYSSASRVLVVEDDEPIRTLLVTALARESFDVDGAADGNEALKLTASNEYAVIVLDLMMPNVNGFEFLERFRVASPSARSVIIVVSAFDDTMTGRLRASDVHAIIRKPFDMPRLVTMVSEVALGWRNETSRMSRGTAVAPLVDDALPPEPATRR